MAHLVPLDFWFFARNELDRQKELFWLAETETPAYFQVFDATYAWELLHCMEALYRKEASIQKLKDVLYKYENDYPQNALRLLFTSNHDENSHSGSEYERLGDGAKAFAVLCATWKNSLPLIYSGQDMPNNKRLNFFDKDTIDWTGEFFLNDFYKTLLFLRKSNEALSDVSDQANTTILSTNTPENIFAFSRKSGKEQVLIILNLSSASAVKFTIQDNVAYGKFKSAFSGVEMDINASTIIEMQKWEYLVYYKVEKA